MRFSRNMDIHHGSWYAADGYVRRKMSDLWMASKKPLAAEEFYPLSDKRTVRPRSDAAVQRCSVAI
jgi:hypothetical protein